MTNDPPAGEKGAAERFDPRSVGRPAPELMRYYTWCAALTLLGFPFVWVAGKVRFNTLRYRLDDEGVWMGVGWLWKRETYVAYRRIQDIHVTRNLFHRWLGLSRIDLMTASGNAGPELTIEGVREPEALRDWLYARMRGAKGEPAERAAAGEAAGSGAEPDEALALLREIRDEVRGLADRMGAGR